MDYFQVVENKYLSRLKPNSYIAIRLDGVNICKTQNLISLKEGSFSYALHKTAKILSSRYECICYAGSDELNIVLTVPQVVNIFDKLEVQKVSSIMGQIVFEEFNKHFNRSLYKNNEYVFFDARSFSIPKNKLDTYILHRQSLTHNSLTIHYAKHYLSYEQKLTYNTYNIKLPDLKNVLNKIMPKYKTLNDAVVYGVIYKNGKITNEFPLYKIEEYVF